jgi:hypothetical protein
MTLNIATACRAYNLDEAMPDIVFQAIRLRRVLSLPTFGRIHCLPQKNFTIGAEITRWLFIACMLLAIALRLQMFKILDA